MRVPRPPLAVTAGWASIHPRFVHPEPDGMPSSLSVLLATACPTLPVYHPDTLMQYAAWGELDRVRAVLRHLYDAVIVTEASQQDELTGSGDATTGPAMPHVWSTRQTMLVDTLPPIALSVLTPAADSGAGQLQGSSLSSQLLAGPSQSMAAASSGSRYDDLFAEPNVLEDDAMDEDLGTDQGEASHGFGTSTRRRRRDESMETIYAKLEGTQHFFFLDRRRVAWTARAVWLH